MKARDIMTANPRTVTPDESVSRAAEIMREADVGVVPVVEDSGSMRLAGLITDRDIALRIVAEGRDNTATVRGWMSASAWPVVSRAERRRARNPR